LSGGLPYEDLVMAASLEDGWRMCRWSIAVHEEPEHKQHKRRDQHRLTAQSLDGMQEVNWTSPDYGRHAGNDLLASPL
jgi:hypothetical protein